MPWCSTWESLAAGSLSCYLLNEIRAPEPGLDPFIGYLVLLPYMPLCFIITITDVAVCGYQLALGIVMLTSVVPAV